MAFLPTPRPAKDRRWNRMWRVFCCLPLHCEASDALWEAYFESRSPAMKWMMWPVIRAAQAAAILPPPPGRLRSLQVLAAVTIMCLANVVAQRIFYNHIQTVLEGGFQIALHAYLVESLLEVLQPPLVLVITWCNLARVCPALAAILMPTGPLRPAPSFIVFTAFLYGGYFASQMMFHFTIFKVPEDYICYSVAAFWSGFSALIMDRLIVLSMTLAALKIQVVNRRLSSLSTKTTSMSVFALSSSESWPPQEPTLGPTVQRGLLQTVANRWENTMEQVTALLGHDMLGLPLLYSLTHMSIGLVTSSSVLIRDETEQSVRLLKLIDLILYLTRVASLAITAGWLYKEAKETETIIGALDTTSWPMRERQRVNHLLHLSREVARLRVCGIVCIDHSFLFSVMGNTVSYLVMLLQYPILTPGKAAEVLNKTETKSIASS